MPPSAWPKTLFLPYGDFKLLSSVGPLKLFEKYKKKASTNLSDPDSAESGQLFLNRLQEHKNNASTGAKNILIVPGLWPGLDWFSAFSLADRILETASFGVFVAVAAHPLSTLLNVHELNPHFFGNFSFPCVEARYFSETPIGTAEFNQFDDSIDFSLARNAKKFIFLKMKKVDPSKGRFPRSLPCLRRPILSTSLQGPAHKKDRVRRG